MLLQKISHVEKVQTAFWEHSTGLINILCEGRDCACGNGAITLLVNCGSEYIAEVDTETSWIYLGKLQDR